LSFEGIFGRDIAAVDFGTDRYLRCSKERTHISRAVLDTYSNAVYLSVGKFHKGAYQSPADVRYVAATSMSYDMLMSVYDVNTRNMFACRLFGFEESTRAMLGSYIDSLKKLKPNLEARLIGLQSKQSFVYLSRVAGSETRHIAIDMKLGVSHDVLLENRLYRPGELINMTTLEQFERSLKH